MIEMDYIVCLFGVEMEILTYNSKISYQEYFDFLRNSLGKTIEENVKFIREK